ncbi:MAG: glutamate--tRNA ligase, partial [Hyphomicrobiales bacterium]|nr:glutamate--tRNA ligase [Hyphomicrobiales bacterium]
ASAKFDEHELEALNGRLLHKTPYAGVADRLIGEGIGGGEAFWLAVRGNCAKLADAAQWWRIIGSPTQPQIDESDRDFLAQAVAFLPGEPFGEASWRDWTSALKDRTGRKGRALFMPLRRALTGLEHGPDMAHLLPLIGRDRVLKRLKGELA